MRNGENVGSKDPPNYLRGPVSNAHSVRPAIEAVESAGGAAQRPPKFDACGPVVDHPPRMPRAAVRTAHLDGCFRGILEHYPDWRPSMGRRKAKSPDLSRERKAGDRPWNREADRVLIACSGFSMKVIQKRMKRSIASIRSSLTVLDRGAESFGGFKTNDLMERLHLDESAIRRMERRHLLLRERGRITEDSVKCLCREHPGEIPFETLDEETKRTLVTDYEYPIPVFDVKKK